MKTIFLSDASDVSLACAKALSKKNVNVLALVVAPLTQELKIEKLVKKFNYKPQVIRSSRPDKDFFIKNLIINQEIDILISAFYEYRIRESLLSAAKFAGINLHPSVLPFNGGHHTSFWGLVKGTPLGATLHWLTEDLDAGGIIAQKTFEDDQEFTASQIRKIQRSMCIELFTENIENILCGNIKKCKGVLSDFHDKNSIIKATTFHENDKIDFKSIMKLGRATSHANHGLTVTNEKNDVYKVKISVTKISSGKVKLNES